MRAAFAVPLDTLGYCLWTTAASMITLPFIYWLVGSVQAGELIAWPDLGASLGYAIVGAILRFSAYIIHRLIVQPFCRWFFRGLAAFD